MIGFEFLYSIRVIFWGNRQVKFSSQTNNFLPILPLMNNDGQNWVNLGAKWESLGAFKAQNFRDRNSES